jgi:hypothetical protein
LASESESVICFVSTSLDANQSSPIPMARKIAYLRTFFILLFKAY